MSGERPKILLLYHRNPTTTAAYLEVALRRHAEVVTAGRGQEVPLIPGARVLLPRLLERLGTRFDLVLEVEGENVDTTGHKQTGVPCAWWAIDSHLHTSYDHHFFRAGAFDHVFVAQKHHVVRYKEWAWTEASWLPLAADTEVFRPHDVPRIFDVGFVGNVLPGLHDARRALLQRLHDGFERVSIVRNVWREDAARAIGQFRIAFNRSLHEDVNMRVFEVVACGRPLLTDRLAEKCGLGELFDAEQHLLVYDDVTFEPTVERWLKDPEGAEARAQSARAHLLERHTYDHRAREILRVIGLIQSTSGSVDSSQVRSAS